MKPLALTVEGFTSFRDRTEIDFSGLDLFAITGPTGAGKSSLIDAIVFALYGQVPRVGDDYKQLISHGAERLSVRFEFGVGSERFQVVRTARRSGASQQRLERRSSTGWEPVADRAREIRGEVDRLLGLDYDGFTRSVVLPQGQFDAFLKGEPKERRKILVALLGLGVYERMLQIANQKVTTARTEADFIRKQLETDYAGVSAEALVARRAELLEGEAQAKRAEAALVAVARGAELAQAARAARREAETATTERADERKALDTAQATLVRADAERAAIERDLAVVGHKLESVAFDEGRLAVLLGAKPRAEQLASLRARLEKVATAVAGKGRAAEEARAALATAEADLPAAEKAEVEAREAEATARADREAAHRAHAAVALRRGLKPGEPCPVCAQPVKAIPAGEAPGLDEKDARAREAEEAARAAADRSHKARLRVEQLRGSADALEREARQLHEQEREACSSVEAVLAEMRSSGFGDGETADAPALADRIQREIVALEAARRARADLETKRQETERKRAALDAAVSAASARLDAARARIESLEARRDEAGRRLAEARAALLGEAGRESWGGLEPLPPGRDEADVLEGLREAAQKASAEGAAAAATLRHAVEALEKGLLRAAELGERRTALERGAALHKTLADHLKANELTAWIQEEALRRLAEFGSRHLVRLSQRRYELRLGPGDEESAARAEQDFFVVDHWNLDSTRSVRTLSGGETFLASLALALALAESLAQLSAEGRAAEALESLFLDEGFGALDAETLDVVVSALDTLHGGQRVVGIVTHLRELAERLPARLEVRRQGSTATAAVI